MRIPESKIAEVAAAADIVRVVSEYVDLKKAGRDYKGICPFHGDKDPSLYVSPHKQIFYCFGCATGGSVFNFVMKIENVSFTEAVRILATRFGVPFEFDARDSVNREGREKLFKVLEIGHSYFKNKLAENPHAEAYLADRGIPSEWIDRLGLGFAPDSWEGLVGRLTVMGADLRDAAAVGLVRARDSGGYYDYFRSRIVIPIPELNGKVVAFGGRIVGQGDPKYLNSPESPVFSKKRLLYGLDSAREAIRKEGQAILVEGYFDQISLRIGGLENTVAPLGTSLGREQVRLVKRFTDRVVTVFDGDEAGVRAAKRAIPIFLAEAMEPRCLILRDDKDPDECIRRIGADGLRRLLDSATPIIDFFLDSLEEDHDLRTIQGRNSALEECFPLLGEIADSAERDYLIERISSRVKVREERVRLALKSARRSRPSGEDSQKSANKTHFDFPSAERNVVKGMLLRDGFVDRVIERGVVKDLEDPVLRDLAHRMVRLRDEADKFDARSFCNSLEDETLAAVVAGWLQPRREQDDLRSDVDADLVLEDSLESIRLRNVHKRKAEILERMRKCLPGADEFVKLAQELQEIGRRLHK